MQVATYLPLLWLGLLYLRESQASFPALLSENSSPLVAVGVCLFLWIIYVLVADLINGQSIESPRREGYLLGAIVLSSFLLIRVSLYPTASLFDFRWIGNTFSAIFNFTDGWRAEIAVILLNLFLWVQVVLSLGRTLTFMAVGLSFRLSLLVAIIGNAFLFVATGLSLPLQLFTILLVFGLFAVAIARIDEKSIAGQHSTGAILSWDRLGLLGVAVAVALSFGLLLAQIYTPQSISTVLRWFSPLWVFIGAVVARIFSALFWLMSPLIQWFIDKVRSLTEGIELLEPERTSNSGEFESLPNAEFFSVSQFLQEWTLVRYLFVLLIIAAVAAFLWLFFVRPYLRQIEDEEESLEQESVNLGLGGLRSGLDRLRNLAKLVGRFGFSLELLDAISIENMYANLCRIARQRGYPRQPNQPPDQYISALREAFPGQGDDLQRLTSAYMRVHYGDQSIERQELNELRSLYQTVRTAKPDEVIS